MISKNKNTDRGFSILESIVGLAIVIVGLIGVIGVNNYSQRLSKKASTSFDLSAIKKSLYESIDCGKTLRNLPVGDPCGANPRYINLFSIDDKLLVSNIGTRNGDFTVRAYCHGGSNRGIEVRAVKLKPGVGLAASSWVGVTNPNPANYLKDEVRGQGAGNTVYDWNHPKSVLSSPGPAGLCAARFGASVSAATCPGSNYYVKSIDFDSQSVVCEPIPNCSNRQTLEFVGNQFECREDLFNQITNYYTTKFNSEVATTTSFIQQFPAKFLKIGQ